MILRKKFWRVILILFIVLIGIISIIFIFRSFSKPHKNSKDKKQSEQTKKKEQKNGDFSDSIKAVDSFADSFNYQPIQPTQKEPEYQGETLPISSTRTEYKKEAIQKNLLPAGSAILTSSGDLEKTGIKAIIHLATLSIEQKSKDEILKEKLKKTAAENFSDPTKAEAWRKDFFLQGKKVVIQNFIYSIQNAIILAERRGHRSIAFPLVDNEFLDLILPPEQSSKSERKHKLARIIIIAALSQSKNLERIIFVGLGREFVVEITRVTKNKHYQKINELSGMYLTSGKGIADYSEHKCEVIVNTTFNVEGKFVGSRGLSGFITNRTGSGKNQIQKEIKECISEFN